MNKLYQISLLFDNQIKKMLLPKLLKIQVNLNIFIIKVCWRIRNQISGKSKSSKSANNIHKFIPELLRQLQNWRLRRIASYQSQME